MDIEEFRKNGHDFVDWMANYLENIESLPVKLDIDPGDIYKQLPDEAPTNGEPITAMQRFMNIVNNFLAKITQKIPFIKTEGEE